MKTTWINRHPLIWCYLFFLYFSFVPHILLYSSGVTGSTGLRQAILMSSLWLIPILLWPNKIKFIAGVIGLILLAGGLTNLGYWLVFGQEFSQSVIFIIFESNISEGSEFLASYYQPAYIAYFALFALIPILMWRKIPELKISNQYRYTLTGMLLFIVSWPLTNTWLIENRDFAAGQHHLLQRLEPASPWNLVVGYVKYTEQLAAVKANLDANSSIEPLTNLTETNPDETKTLVIVIGESTNRQRMGLYGYERDTTPELSAIRDELLVFDDVVTPRPYTIEALQQVLSFADTLNPEAYFTKPTLLNMMKQAGYEITWITNQQTQTRRNTLLTTLSQLADNQIYLNNNRTQNASQYDGAVIAPFAKAVHSDARKKLIIVHLLGTHRSYDYRYPESFNHFSNYDKAPSWISDKNIDEYNSYDNAILYNDHVVSELINNVRDLDHESLLVYFSDHGEEVYDYADKPFSGRNEAAPSPAMYTVPFIVWQNDEFKQQNNTHHWQEFTQRPYTSSEFIYTWADMAGIDFDGMDTKRSLISEHYQVMPRWIGNPDNPKTIIDYNNVEKKFFPAQSADTSPVNNNGISNKKPTKENG